MRLKKNQKEAVIEWIAAGLLTNEINLRAADFEPPFVVSRQQVDHYRKTRAVAIDAILSTGEHDALNSGLALAAVRVERLQRLAAMMEKDLFGGFLWLEQVKGIGSGNTAEIVEYEEFNSAEVAAYRGVLDDIAKEVGGRVQKKELTGADGNSVEIKVVYLGTDDDD